MEGFWRYLEAEALDALDAREPGAKVLKAIVIAEVDRDPGGAHPGHQEVQITRHEAGRALRPAEASGLLARALARTVDS